MSIVLVRILYCSPISCVTSSEYPSNTDSVTAIPLTFRSKRATINVQNPVRSHQAAQIRVAVTEYQIQHLASLHPLNPFRPSLSLLKPTQLCLGAGRT